MQMDSLTQMKQSYIEYALFHYHFKSRISVWLLNYIKASDKMLSQIHFVVEKIPSHPTLELSLVGADDEAIQYKYHHNHLINSNEIFNVIISQSTPFDILIHFPLHVGPDAKLEQLILAQIVQSERYQSYLPYIHTLSSNSTLQHQFLSQLYENIDLSLLMHNTERFTQLTHVLNTIKAQHMTNNNLED